MSRRSCVARCNDRIIGNQEEIYPNEIKSTISRHRNQMTPNWVNHRLCSTVHNVDQFLSLCRSTDQFSGFSFFSSVQSINRQLVECTLFTRSFRWKWLLKYWTNSMGIVLFNSLPFPNRSIDELQETVPNFNETYIWAGLFACLLL